ncbi:MAG: DMT family transporter [bacterium]|nr:DMT family transporter [bacterium]
MNPPSIPPKLGLAIAVVALSLPAIFIRLAGADGLSIAFLRLLIAAALLWPFAARQVIQTWKKITPSERRRVIWAGGFLGLHLLFWVTSVTKTTIASAAFLIITQPILVAVLAHFMLKERLTRWSTFAILLALGGSALINSGDIQLGRQYLWGDFLALVGSGWAAFYIIAGRSVRRQIDLLPYITMIYTVAALILIPFCIVLKAPLLSLSKDAYFWIIMLALIPTLIGHTMYNWALRYLKAFTVNAGIIVEPIIATSLAWFIFQEQPSSLLYPGAALLIFSLFLAFRGEEG